MTTEAADESGSVPMTEAVEILCLLGIGRGRAVAMIETGRLRVNQHGQVTRSDLIAALRFVLLGRS